ncbi:MAG: hypothetical protein RLZZ15_812 [Verrucomicrobiota bacterium]
MIDERHEELAALHALDLLAGAERAAFERALAADPALRLLVDDLRESAAQLAHLAPAAPPPAALRARVLAALDAPAAAPTANVRGDDDDGKIIRPAVFGLRQIFPWAAAAAFALGAAWFWQRQLNAEAESALLRQQQTFAELLLKNAEQHREAERLLADRRLADAQRQADDTTRQLADARAQLSTRDTSIASLTQTIETLTASGTALDRALGEARDRVALLTAQLKTEGDLAHLKITALASMLKNSPEALAVAVWNPAHQEGVLQVANLPALAANQDYQLWVVDPQYPAPVDGGVFTVDAATGVARVAFKAKQPVNAINAFAVTLERKGGVPKAEGPFVLLGK